MWKDKWKDKWNITHQTPLLRNGEKKKSTELKWSYRSIKTVCNNVYWQLAKILKTSKMEVEKEGKGFVTKKNNRFSVE